MKTQVKTARTSEIAQDSAGALNPLYSQSVVKPADSVQTRQETTAGMMNLVAGTCPKCGEAMGQASLGAHMGNQKVDYCPRCRVAEPCKVI